MGLQVGDPILPDSLKSTLYLLSQHFHKLSKKDNLQEELIGKDQFIDNNYLKQDGIKISKNVQIKIKPFGYGYKIKDFHPINDNFSCETKILAVQSSGSVVPIFYDQIIINDQLSDERGLSVVSKSLYILDLPKYRQQEGNYSHYPFRFWAGNRLLGGYSDHLAIKIKIKKN